MNALYRQYASYKGAVTPIANLSFTQVYLRISANYALSITNYAFVSPCFAICSFRRLMSPQPIVSTRSPGFQWARR